MKRLSLILVILCGGILAMAQQPVLTKGATLNGTVQEQQKAPIAYVTVSIIDASAKLIAGTMSDEKGNFKLEGIPMGNFTLQLSLLGYQTINQPLQITSNNAIHLGAILLSPDPLLLKEVNVVGEKAAISLKLDKKVFETGKDILSQTGSATDLLNSVPSVSVSPTGAISLRGNGNVLILINGRRSGVVEGNALEQLPADQIERIEVITNPSSRYDAAGSAGIINIVLKKNKKAGFNGQLRLVGGIPNETRITPSLNYKSDKINLFSTFGIRLSDYDGLYKTKQSISNGANTQLLDQVQNEDRHDDAKMLYLGADILLNEHHTITAAFLKNATNDHDKTDLNYAYTTAGKGTDSTLLRKGESWEKRNYNQLEFNFTKTFTKPGKKYTFDMQYDFWNSDKDWNLSTQRLTPSNINQAAIRTSSIGASKDLLLQTDFVLPVDSLSTLELGLKMENRRVTSDFKAEQQQQNDWQVFNGINNRLAYNELIGSAYAQYGSKLGKLAYQLGLRTELTRIKIEDRAGSYHNNKNYTRLFPTLNMSYPLAQNATLQASYSRRINRPSLNLLYPFNELTDFNAQFMGNPDLDPSFAHVLEIGFLKNWSKFTFNPSLYYQYNNQVIVDYTMRNTQGVFITSPININSETRQGIELSTLYNPLKWLQLNFELNAYRFKQLGFYKNQNFDFTGEILTSRLGTQLKLPNKLAFQVRYNFTGAQSNAQSHTQAVHNIDVGVSKNLFKDKATLLFDATNLFDLREFTTTTTGINYVIAQTNRPNAARYRLTFVYRLNLKENQNVRQAKTGNRN